MALGFYRMSEGKSVFVEIIIIKKITTGQSIFHGNVQVVDKFHSFICVLHPIAFNLVLKHFCSHEMVECALHVTKL